MITKKIIKDSILEYIEQNYGGEVYDPCYDIDGMAAHFLKAIRRAK